MTPASRLGETLEELDSPVFLARFILERSLARELERRNRDFDRN